MEHFAGGSAGSLREPGPGRGLRKETGAARVWGDRTDLVSGAALKFRPWSHDSESDVVDLTGPLGRKTYTAAYVWARVNMAEEKEGLLGIGSDDAIKVRLNGKLIHENGVQRPCTKDSDLVPVTFRRGRNFLVLKIQNGTADWAFSCRLLGPEALAERLLSSARAGQIDSIYGVTTNRLCLRLPPGSRGERLLPDGAQYFRRWDWGTL
jgi:hypothetical protein